MSPPLCRLPVDVFALTTTLLLAQFVDSPSSNVPTATPAAQLSKPNPKVATRVESFETVNMVVDTDVENQRQLQKPLRAVPQEKQAYAILIVPPDSSRGCKILKVEPDPTRSYSIAVVDPKTNEPESAVTTYFGNDFPALTKDAVDPGR